MLPMPSDDGRPNAPLRTEDLASFSPRLLCRCAAALNINTKSKTRQLQPRQLWPPRQCFSSFDGGRKPHTIKGSCQFAVEALSPTFRDTNTWRRQSGLGREECLDELLTFTQKKHKHIN